MCHVTDAVGLAPSLLPRPGAVALPSPSPSPPPRLRVSGVVWSDACVPGFGSGLARESVWVGLVLRLVCEVLVSVSCVSRLPPVSLNRVPATTSSQTPHRSPVIHRHVPCPTLDTPEPQLAQWARTSVKRPCQKMASSSCGSAAMMAATWDGASLNDRMALGSYLCTGRRSTMATRSRRARGFNTTLGPTCAILARWRRAMCEAVSASNAPTEATGAQARAHFRMRIASSFVRLCMRCQRHPCRLRRRWLR